MVLQTEKLKNERVRWLRIGSLLIHVREIESLTYRVEAEERLLEEGEIAFSLCRAFEWVVSGVMGEPLKIADFSARVFKQFGEDGLGITVKLTNGFVTVDEREFRRRGIGTEMMSECIRWANNIVQDSPARVQRICYMPNGRSPEDASRFYRQFGLPFVERNEHGWPCTAQIIRLDQVLVPPRKPDLEWLSGTPALAAYLSNKMNSWEQDRRTRAHKEEEGKIVLNRIKIKRLRFAFWVAMIVALIAIAVCHVPAGNIIG